MTRLSTGRLRVPLGAGAMDAYLALPAQPSGFGLVLGMTIWGVDAELCRVADDYAALGFTVIAPNLYWRQREKHGADSNRDRDLAVAIMMKARDEDAVGDMAETVSFLRNELACHTNGLLGWCFGGRIVCLTACAHSVDSVVAYYPTNLEKHLSATAGIPVPTVLHLPLTDQYASVSDAREQIEQTFANNGHVTVYRYSDVSHGFDFGQHFEHHAARRADLRTAVFFTRRMNSLGAPT